MFIIAYLHPALENLAIFHEVHQGKISRVIVNFDERGNKCIILSTEMVSVFFGRKYFLNLDKRL